MDKEIYVIILKYGLLLPLLAIVYAIHGAAFVLSPIYEQTNCRENTCYTTEISVFGTNSREIKDKNKLEIEKVSDVINMNQYYIRIENDNERYLFRSAYFLKRNAERDLKKVLNNSEVKITKKNVHAYQFICFNFFIILLISLHFLNNYIKNNKTK